MQKQQQQKHLCLSKINDITMLINFSTEGVDLVENYALQTEEVGMPNYVWASCLVLYQLKKQKKEICIRN